MNEKTRIQIEEMKKQTFGTEVEMYDITREDAAKATAEYFGQPWKYEHNSDRIRGLYCDGVIAVNSRIGTSAERSAVIAEELGHCLTAVGNILDQSVPANRKQELRGRVWAYNPLIGMEGILRAYKAGCRNRYETAEYLEIPEDTLQEAVDYYHARYGLYFQLDNYVIYFEPLGVMELI